MTFPGIRPFWLSTVARRGQVPPPSLLANLPPLGESGESTIFESHPLHVCIHAQEAGAFPTLKRAIPAGVLNEKGMCTITPVLWQVPHILTSL